MKILDGLIAAAAARAPATTTAHAEGHAGTKIKRPYPNVTRRPAGPSPH